MHCVCSGLFSDQGAQTAPPNLGSLAFCGVPTSSSPRLPSDDEAKMPAHSVPASLPSPRQRCLLGGRGWAVCKLSCAFLSGCCPPDWHKGHGAGRSRSSPCLSRTLRTQLLCVGHTTCRRPSQGHLCGHHVACQRALLWLAGLHSSSPAPCSPLQPPAAEQAAARGRGGLGLQGPLSSS